MNRVSPMLIVSVSALTALFSPAQADYYPYEPSFVELVNRVERSTKQFHQGYLYSQQGHARGRHKLFVTELCAAAELSSAIALQVRQGFSPCRIEAKSRQLESCYQKISQMACGIPMSPCLRSTYEQMSLNAYRFDRAIDRVLYAYEHRGNHHQPAVPGLGNYRHDGPHADYPQAVRVNSSEPRDVFLRYVASRFAQ